MKTKSKRRPAVDEVALDLSESTLAAIRYAQVIVEKIVELPILCYADIRHGRVKRMDKEAKHSPVVRTTHMSAFVASRWEKLGMETKFRLNLIHTGYSGHWSLAPKGNYARYGHDNIRIVEFDGDDITVRILSDEEEQKLSFNLR